MDPETIFNAIWEVIFEELQRLEDVEGSRWVLVSIDNVTITFTEISPIVGSSYKPLPKELEERRENGIDNSKGDDQQCFKWAQTRNKFPPKEKLRKRKNIVTDKLKKQSEKLKWDGINYPTALSEIGVFDNLNKISTTVLG